MINTGIGGLSQLGTVNISEELIYVRDVSWIPWVDADGVASRTIVRHLAKNALVRKFAVRVGAGRAQATTLANSGQVRLQNNDPHTKLIVVDFGMLRTVSGIARVDDNPVAAALTICSLRAYKGDAFDTNDLYVESCGGAGMPTPRSGIDANTFETRTDRVRIMVKSDAPLTDISNALSLQFPDLPTDLDIRINGGAPAWTSPGVAQPNTRGWDDDTQQTVDLTAALASLTGDPHDASLFDATIVLASRVPGLLTLDDTVTGAVDIAYLARVTFGPEEGGAESATLDLEQEGIRDVVLPLPSWVTGVEEVRFTMTGTVPPERILDPVGPVRAMRSGGDASAYDLLLDVDHAGVARLDPATPLAELAAVRLPLRAGPDGAEVRAVLYQGTVDGPTTPVAGGTSAPVDLAPAAATVDDVWTSFPMAKPVKLDHKLTYWVVVAVGRGGVSWSLGTFPTPQSVVPVLRGAATGPWHALPSAIGAGMNLGARIRAVGKAPPTAPVAPLTVSVVGNDTTQVDATPTPKGVNGAWIAPSVIPPSVAGSARSVTLRITSRMTGTIALSAVDVVATQ